MEQDFYAKHWVDHDGNPQGGTAWGPGFAISWQMGPLGSGAEREEPNGAFVETIINATIDRLKFYQEGKFMSSYNDTAIAQLESALVALRQRTSDRISRGVEGTHAD